MRDFRLTTDAVDRFSHLQPLSRDEWGNGFALAFDGVWRDRVRRRFLEEMTFCRAG